MIIFLSNIIETEEVKVENLSLNKFILHVILMDELLKYIII